MRCTLWLFTAGSSHTAQFAACRGGVQRTSLPRAALASAAGATEQPCCATADYATGRKTTQYGWQYCSSMTMGLALLTASPCPWTGRGTSSRARPCSPSGAIRGKWSIPLEPRGLAMRVGWSGAAGLTPPCKAKHVLISAEPLATDSKRRRVASTLPLSRPNLPSCILNVECCTLHGVRFTVRRICRLVFAQSALTFQPICMKFASTQLRSSTSSLIEDACTAPATAQPQSAALRMQL